MSLFEHFFCVPESKKSHKKMKSLLDILSNPKKRYLVCSSVYDNVEYISSGCLSFCPFSPFSLICPHIHACVCIYKYLNIKKVNEFKDILFL